MSHLVKLFAMLVALATAGACAAGDDLRSIAIQQTLAVTAPLTEHDASTDPHLDAFYANMMKMLPQQRAEHALELAINRHADAAEYVMRNAQNWRGQLQSSDRLAALTLTAMNSPRLNVRMAGFEVQLAQDGVAKTPQEVEHLIQRLHEDPHGVGAWELWHLGVLGARGVARERIFSVLVATTRSEDNELRHWAVESLAPFGGVEIINPLLSVAANDRLQTIRERAFCGLTESGTLRLAERYAAIPGLLAIAEDPHSDRQNIDWSYQALREITNIRDLPQDPRVWRVRLRSLGLLAQTTWRSVRAPRL